MLRKSSNSLNPTLIQQNKRKFRTELNLWIKEGFEGLIGRHTKIRMIMMMTKNKKSKKKSKKNKNNNLNLKMIRMRMTKIDQSQLKMININLIINKDISRVLTTYKLHVRWQPRSLHKIPPKLVPLNQNKAKKKLLVLIQLKEIMREM